MKTNQISDLEGFIGTVVIPVYETNSDSITFEGIEISEKIFKGKKDTHYLLEQNGNLFLFVGIGKAIDYKSLKTIFRRVAKNQKEILDKSIALYLSDEIVENEVEAIVSGMVLGTYELGHFKKVTTHPFLNPDFELQIFSKNDHTAVINKAIKVANSQLQTFALVDLPPNKVTPKYLANWAIETGAKFGFQVEVLGREACEKEGLGAFVAVGKGSENEPQFIIMNYEPKEKGSNIKHLGLVGKGITFDTGGLNIKTAGMLHMKCDMAGGAAVLGAMQLIADLQLPIKVTGIVPCAENSVDAKSFLPSDVITSYSGNTIEIIDTDAEGRLVLADGLSYLIKNYKIIKFKN